MRAILPVWYPGHMDASPSPHDLRVLVVADDHLARAGLAALLVNQPGCSVVGQVTRAEYASVGPYVYLADAVVWDLGWEAAEAVAQWAEVADSGPPAVALVATDSQASAAWAAGARGILRREAEEAILMSALVAVTQGLAALDPELASTLVPKASAPEATTPAPELTPRELEVLELLADGLPNKLIADRLEISEHTVKFHVNAILGRLGAQSRTEAVSRALRVGLLSL